MAARLTGKDGQAVIKDRAKAKAVDVRSGEVRLNPCEVLCVESPHFAGAAPVLRRDHSSRS